MARRPQFAAGEDHADEADDTTVRYHRRPCDAHGCPMPGAIFLNGHDAPGICAWHFGANGSDFPRITAALLRWQCVSDEINAARRVINDPMMATDVKAQKRAIHEAWIRLQPAVDGSGWEAALKPLDSEPIGDWCRRITDFLVVRINTDVVGTTGDMTQTATVRDMHTRLRGAIGNAGAHAA